MKILRYTSRTVLALAALLTLSTGACSSPGQTPTSSGTTRTVRSNVAADAKTRQIAQVEFIRQCSIGAQSFPKEADLTTDLDNRLAAAHLTHLAWKNWHDELATSPQLVTQLHDIAKTGCPKS